MFLKIIADRNCNLRTSQIAEKFRFEMRSKQVFPSVVTEDTILKIAVIFKTTQCGDEMPTA